MNENGCTVSTNTGLRKLNEVLHTLYTHHENPCCISTCITWTTNLSH